MQAPPKFSSFRPKQPASTASAPESAASRQPESKHSDHDSQGSRRHHRRHDEEKSRHKHRHRHHEHHHTRDKSHTQSKHQVHELSPVRATATGPDVFEDDTDDLFVVDRRGDLNNVKYGYNENYKVPSYHTPSLRKLVGDNERGGEDGSSTCSRHLASHI